ncbi:response regulator [Pelagicoccus sp. NFK12]|uniref:Response regulator n=1 Tax=Pelagicoccus enzymogenes TaxID=2773457 RepID=A0A927FB59_9BACT|nr:response regulator [Pelagicoccus enzymogenes]MBD5780561.1 response regulator [Pelagicoccus enzymogenes]MDQ8199038.1 response regulator [Pelagicoccus enzymogenes]
MKENGRPIEMLLVEDNEADIRLTEIALQQSKLENRLHVVRDGEQALEFLKREGEYADAVRPDLILLDLNLPKVTGAEVLKEIRETSSLKSLPVVVLTTSDADKDIYESYELQANCYITKPVDLRKFMGVVEMIEDFWARVSKS